MTRYIFLIISYILKILGLYPLELYFINIILELFMDDSYSNI